MPFKFKTDADPEFFAGGGRGFQPCEKKFHLNFLYLSTSCKAKEKYPILPKCLFLVGVGWGVLLLLFEFHFYITPPKFWKKKSISWGGFIATISLTFTNFLISFPHTCNSFPNSQNFLSCVRGGGGGGGGASLQLSH